MADSVAPPIETIAATDAPKRKGSGAVARAARIQDMTMLNVPNEGDGGNVSPLFSAADVADARRANAWLSDRLKQSAALPPGNLFSEVVTITPAAAEVILTRCNRGNRAIRSLRVRQYADTMADGRWKLTSQGLSFSRQGQLNNGQHRLHAIIAAGRPIPMTVSFGEDRDVFDVLDAGGMRGASDTLHVGGYKNTSLLAAAARLLMIIEVNPTANASFANDVVKNWVDLHSDLEAYTTPGGTIGKRLKTSPAAITAASYLIDTQSEHARRFSNFTAHLADGIGLSNKRDPILVLRDNLMSGNIAGRNHPGVKGVIIAGSVIKTWNLWLRGKTASLPAVQWVPGTPFPKPE